jgi:putative transposase
MARKLRVEYAGAIYHVINRGDRREPIVRDDQDRLRFLDTLGEACSKTGWEVHAWCLMENHFHLVIETPTPNLVAGMKWFLGTYTSRFNRRHKVSGHLFSGRYKSLIVDSSGNGYLHTVCDYVHLNPARAKLLSPDQSLREYAWSSYNDYLKRPSRRPEWMRVDRLFGEMGIPKDSLAGRRQFEWRMEQRRQLDDQEALRAVRDGWCLGDEEFRRELVEQMTACMGCHHGGKERQEMSAAKAERITAEELQRRKWNEADLTNRRKGDGEKLAIARRLRRETTMTLAWIARRLQMGSGGYLANCLRENQALNHAVVRE